MASGVYNRFKANLMKKFIDLQETGDDIKVALLDSNHSFNSDHNVWADVSANEISGTGYSAGGASLGNQVVSQDDTDDEGVFDASDTTWATATITARYAVLYDDSLTSDDLICCIDFGTDKSSSGGDFTIQWNSEGIINLG